MIRNMGVSSPLSRPESQQELWHVRGRAASRCLWLSAPLHRHLSLPASGGGAGYCGPRDANRNEGDEVPELPEGFRVDVEEKGWRH